jgi:hypothetical protein
MNVMKMSQKSQGGVYEQGERTSFGSRGPEQISATEVGEGKV